MPMISAGALSGQAHALLELALLGELRGARDQRDALVVVELLPVRVDLPALRRGVGLLEHPAVAPRELDRGVRPAEQLVHALVAVRQRRVVVEVRPVVELERTRDRVGDLAAVLVQADAAVPADRRPGTGRVPVEDLELVRAPLAREPDRDRRVQPPVEHPSRAAGR
jgi:hypothetical protein